jgi:hypothetical protein
LVCHYGEQKQLLYTLLCKIHIHILSVCSEPEI